MTEEELAVIRRRDGEAFDTWGPELNGVFTYTTKRPSWEFLGDSDRHNLLAEVDRLRKEVYASKLDAAMTALETLGRNGIVTSASTPLRNRSVR